ncbi:chemotaxis protein CheW [Pseudobdellovibrio exovorus]|uniref:histidine kinase n=1 Tax=Pseudobdellovibrio exovorus JSS TaxID=1184267 RepID=M4V948_9BACT|nr:chemotaxis protein CheW [Pseudobdellovibrio exovorus]AGH94531.1 hypothetical protein A11Q_311 [Pseudobdellovibrio exovorus JSS]
MSFSEQDLEEFKVEALELLDTAEKSLLALDQGADFKSSFDSIFRGFHNLKGAAGMMDLTHLQAHTHELESILMQFKEASALPKEHINFFLRGIDAAKSILDGNTISFDYAISGPANTVSLTATAPTPTLTAETTPASSQHQIPKEAIDEFMAEGEEILERISKVLSKIESGDFAKDNLDSLYRDVHSLKGTAYLFSFTSLGDLSHAMESSLEKVRSGTHLPSKPLLNGLFQCLNVADKLFKKTKSGISDSELVSEIPQVISVLNAAAEQLSSVNVAPVEVAPPTMAAPAAVKDSAETEAASSIRVPVALLDNLMTLMGEMVLVRNQVLQFSNKSEDLEFLSLSKRLNVVTSEIQGEMMKTRMQPIGNVLGKFTRVVRDLSQDLGKKIHLSLSGTETELDKSLLEAIKDPLTHIVRNSCDHGIETPDVRSATGKPEAGSIAIRAYHEGGQVIIDIQDDGKGLNQEVLVKKAIEKGILSTTEAAKLTEKQINNLIFAPGFSTAAKVTNVSGRGVGMDVVRTNIERIGGTIDLSSRFGAGTVIKIKIPLTLAIIPALTVRCGTGTFAIPQVKLEELVRVDQTSANRIEDLHGAPVLRLRGNILPLVDLNKVLKTGSETNYTDGIINVAILNAEQASFGLIIDQVYDTADIVVKPLNRLLKSLQAYSGATILGDGSVALILDVLGIAKIAQIGQEKTNTSELEDAKAKAAEDLQDYLLVKTNSATKHAIVLGYVHRIEEFKKQDVEYSGQQPVVRYGDSILPLISVNEAMGYPQSELEQETVPTVVIRRAGQLYGLQVDNILDTLSSTAELDLTHIKHSGIFGNLNTPEELIVVVDPFELIEHSFPESSIAKAPSAVTPAATATAPIIQAPIVSGQSRKILLAEDTVFFRKSIRSVLEKVGYEVVTAVDGQEALEFLNKNDAHFDLIISDIEMPRLNGFQLAQAVRQHPRFIKTPLLAVSSRADSKFIAEGKQAGFNLYLEKLKPDLLLNAINQLLTQESSAA